MAADDRDMLIYVHSPKDGMVKNIPDNLNGVVEKGAVICHLDPDDENRAMARLQFAADLVELEHKLLSDEQISLRRRLVEIATEITAKYLEYADSRLSAARSQQQAGVAIGLVVKQYEAAFAKASGEHEKAKIALKTFDFNVELMKSRYELVSSQIPSEKDFVVSREKCLEITAPVDGKIRFLVGTNSFIKLGQNIAEISLQSDS